MNILFINSIAPRKFGGGEKWMLKAARGLADAGHNVFVASKRGAEILKYARKAGLPAHIFNVRADISPVATYRIYRFLRRENIDILVCNLNKDVRVAGLAARLAGNVVVIARHGILLCGKKWKHKLTLTRLTDGILTNSRTIKQAYLNYGWFDDSFIRVIYNGIEPKPNVQAHNFAEHHPGKKIILSAGRLSEQKGFAYLIEAAARLRQRDDLAFVIAGKGRLESRLRQLVSHHGLQDRVHLIGFTDNLDPLIKGCDLLVLASLFEGMPNVVMEAMALGKAVVATDVNGVRELMVPDRTGLIVPPRDAAALAQSISVLIDDPVRREQMGRLAQRRVREHFTIERMVSELEGYFIEKLQEKRNHEPIPANYRETGEAVVSS